MAIDEPRVRWGAAGVQRRSRSRMFFSSANVHRLPQRDGLRDQWNATRRKLALARRWSPRFLVAPALRDCPRTSTRARAVQLPRSLRSDLRSTCFGTPYTSAPPPQRPSFRPLVAPALRDRPSTAACARAVVQTPKRSDLRSFLHAGYIGPQVGQPLSPFVPASFRSSRSSGHATATWSSASA